MIAGLTGALKADAGVHASIERLGAVIDSEAAHHITPAPGTAVWSTSDADDEVRVIVRGIVDTMRDGVPLERMAVVLGNSEPYARLLHEHLDLSGIRHNGVSVRTLADSVLGRGLLRLFALPDHGFRRDDVLALIASAPLFDGQGRPVADGAAWERISRDAGVVGGLADWTARLDHYASGLADPDPDERSTWADRERARTRALQKFVATIAADLARAPGTWHDLTRWAHGLIARWFGAEPAAHGLVGVRAGSGPPGRRRRRPPRRARRGRVGPHVGGVPAFAGARARFRSWIASAGWVKACWWAPRHLALGVELERVWVCGLAEGVFPTTPRDDPLLSDADRSALEGELPLRRDRIADDQRALLATLASTTADRVLCYPRGDLRRNTEHVPSRFLLDTVEVLSGTRRLGRELELQPWYTAVPSYVYGLSNAPFPATRHELDVRAMLAGDPRMVAVPEVRARYCASRPAQHRTHPLRRQPLAPAGHARGRQPHGGGSGGVGDAARSVGEVPARVLRALPARRAAGRASRGAHPALGARQGQHRARHALPVPV